ncbi:MAG: ComF family protein [Sphingobium sp.]
MNPLRQFATAILDFALPSRCPNCLDIVEEQHSFCGPCWRSIQFLGDPCCATCGVPFDYDLGPGAQCGACLADPPPFDRARAVMAYGKVARTVTLRFKYGRRTGHARLIARHMARHLVDVPMEGVLLIPVPLDRWRLWARGFNQSALIATALAREAGGEAANDMLVRTRRTPPLRRMSAARRRKLVKGAFAVAPDRVERLRGRHVVLIDDIRTTGSTAAACARALRRQGAARVDLLCWAQVLDEATDEPSDALAH